MPKEKATIRSLIDEHDLMRWQVADMLEVSIRTVDGWLLPPNSTHHRNAPPMAARLLDRLCKEEKRSKKRRETQRLKEKEARLKSRLND